MTDRYSNIRIINLVILLFVLPVSLGINLLFSQHETLKKDLPPFTNELDFSIADSLAIIQEQPGREINYERLIRRADWVFNSEQY